jgi:tripartite ATP-independent transporter DctP family solute receptor
MKYRLPALLVCLAILSLPCLVGAETTIKFGHSGSTTHSYHIGAVKFAELVGKYSNGDLKVELFPNSQLGGEQRLAESIRLGVVDMGALSADGVLSAWLPEYQVLGMPYLFRDRAHAYKVLDGPIGEELKMKAAAKGINVVSYWEIGFRHMTNNKRPIKTVADMAGLKIRVQPSKVFVTMMESLGAIGTPIAFTELYSALQQGVVDGEENPVATIRSMKFNEVQKYLSLTGHTYSTAAVMISEKLLKKLTPAQLQVVQKAAAEARDYQRATLAKMEGDDLAYLESQGMKVNTVDTAPFVKATSAVYDAMKDQAPPALVQAIRSVR